MTDPDGTSEGRLRKEPRLINPEPVLDPDAERPGVEPEPGEASVVDAGPGGEEIAVDRLVDETGATIEVPPEKTVEAAGPGQPSVGGTGPTNWWRIGLIAVAIVAAILFALQLLNVGPADTDAPSPGEPEAVTTGEPEPLPADEPVVAE